MSLSIIPEIKPYLSHLKTETLEYLETIVSSLHEAHQVGRFLDLNLFFHELVDSIRLHQLELDETLALIAGKIAFQVGNLFFLTQPQLKNTEKFSGFRSYQALGWAFRAEMPTTIRLIDQLSSPTCNKPLIVAEIEAAKGFIHSIQRNAHETLKAEEKIRGLAEKDPLIITHVLPLIVIRRVYLFRRTREQVDQGINELREIIQLQEREGNRYFLAKSHLRLGQLHSNLDELQEAERCYLNSLQVAKEINAGHLLSIIKNRWGMLLVEKKQLADAKRLFLESLAQARSCGARWLEAAPLINISQFFWNKRNPEIAIRAIESFYHIARLMQDPQDMAVALNILSHLHGMIGNADLAIHYMLQAMEAKKKLHERTSASSL